MSVQVGRNHPCPCGSGRKYKLCCGVEELARRDRAARHRLRFGGGSERELRDRLVRELMAFSDRVLGHRGIERARESFLGTEPELDPANIRRRLGDGVAEMVDIAFREWLIHDHLPLSGGPVIARYLEREGDALPDRARAHLEESAATVLSVYEIESVDPGSGLVLTDLVRGGTVRVVERTGSRSLARWDAIVARLIEVDGDVILSGSLLVVRRDELPGLLDHVARRRAAWEGEGGPGSVDEFLKQAGPEIVRHVVSEWLTPRLPVLTTMDGEPLVFCRADYAIEDEQAVRAALESHPDVEEFEDDEFVWHGPASGVREVVETDGPVEERILRGRIELEEGALRLETKSEERLAALRRLVEEAAGPALIHRGDTVEDPLSRLDDLRTAASEPDEPRLSVPHDPSVERPGPSASEIPFDVEEEMIGALMERHYRAWLDESVPALDGASPREAVRTESGRARVLELIKGIENQNDRARREGRPGWDPSWLREELGLD